MNTIWKSKTCEKCIYMKDFCCHFKPPFANDYIYSIYPSVRDISISQNHHFIDACSKYEEDVHANE